jgi:hypothetical protein
MVVVPSLLIDTNPCGTRNQHKQSKGVVGIFGAGAKSHDITVKEISHLVIDQLKKEYPQLSFQYKAGIKKEEINEALKKVDPELGQTLFVSNSSNQKSSAPRGGVWKSFARKPLVSIASLYFSPQGAGNYTHTRLNLMVE